MLDTVIIGAGAAGLACGNRLRDQGAHAVIVEARNRIGGRVHTVRYAGLPPVEVGAQVIHGDRSVIWDSIRTAGLGVTPIARSEEFVIRAGGRTRSMSELAHLGVAAPWIVAERLITESHGDIAATAALERLGVRGRARMITAEWLAQTWAADVADLSVAGLRARAGASRAGPREIVVLDGFDTLIRHLAAGLHIRLGTPATFVSCHDGQVVVLAGPDTLTARAVVVTLPPTVAVGHIGFDPPLAQPKLAAATGLASGDAISVILVASDVAPVSTWALHVDEPAGIWRADAASAVIRAWLKGPAAGRARRPGQRPWAALAAEVFGWLSPGDVVATHVVDWGTDPYARGAFSYPRVGASGTSARWAEPVDGMLFFAGEATCGDRHAALVQGAIESGVRAADEVLACIGR